MKEEIKEWAKILNKKTLAFRLKCVSDLYRNLGKYDAIVELTEISVREFLKQAEAHGEFDSFLQLKSTEHGIRVNSVDQSIYRSRISQSYILSVYQSTEAFIYDFKVNYNDLYYLKKISFDDSKENLLIKLIRKISAYNPAVEKIGRFRMSIFNYYRVVRNKYSHDRIDDSKVEDVYNEIKKWQSEIDTNYPGLSAPNTFEKISFDDFILFSRTVKDIADILNQLVVPKPGDFTDFYKAKNLYKKYNENPERKKNSLIAHMNNNFGLELSEALEVLVSLA